MPMADTATREQGRRGERGQTEWWEGERGAVCGIASSIIQAHGQGSLAQRMCVTRSALGRRRRQGMVARGAHKHGVGDVPSFASSFSSWPRKQVRAMRGETVRRRWTAVSRHVSSWPVVTVPV